MYIQYGQLVALNITPNFPPNMHLLLFYLPGKEAGGENDPHHL
jgi:hypothetical protein